MPITATTNTAITRIIGFLRSYVFSTDHKIIGIQYGLTALCFLLFGFFLMILMRWQIRALRVAGSIHRSLCWKNLSASPAAKGVVRPTSTIPSARCTGRSWCFWASCRWRSRRSAITLSR